MSYYAVPFSLSCFWDGSASFVVYVAFRVVDSHMVFISVWGVNSACFMFSVYPVEVGY